MRLSFVDVCNEELMVKIWNFIHLVWLRIDYCFEPFKCQLYQNHKNIKQEAVYKGCRVSTEVKTHIDKTNDYYNIVLIKY